MANHFKLPYVLPFQFVPCTDTPGIHFHDSWACEQIKSFEKRATYRQKWQKADTTPLQCESSIAPMDLALYNSSGVAVKTFEWSSVFTALSYQIYQCTFDVSDVPDGVYFLYQRVNLLSVDWKAISEPIHIATKWKNTLSFRYKNSFNKDDVAWSTGIEMKFRCEAGIMDFNPEADISDYINQVADREILDGVPSESFKLYIGDAAGVAPYITGIINRIFTNDFVSIEGLEYCRASKLEISRQKNYPLVGASLEIVPGRNIQSLEFADTTPLAPGIITAYNIETGFFGPGTIVPIEEVLENG